MRKVKKKFAYTLHKVHQTEILFAPSLLTVCVVLCFGGEWLCVRGALVMCCGVAWCGLVWFGASGLFMMSWAVVVLWCLGRWWFLWYFSDYCVGIGVFVEIICSCFRWLHLNDGKMEEFREMSFTRNSRTHIRPWSDSFFV